MPSANLTNRLSTEDALFLYSENPNQPIHVGACTVYDGHISREAVMDVLRQRIHLLPRYRQKVVFPLFGLAQPSWEDDPDFDLHYHVEEVTLPAPGDDRVLSEVGGQMFAPMLDRNRPLWKLILLQGRQDGSTAMVLKAHHAMVDGIAGVDLAMVLHDLTPEIPRLAPPPAWQPHPPRDLGTLTRDAMRDRATQVARLWTDAAIWWLRPEETARRSAALAGAATTALPSLLIPKPDTPFNGRLSPERQFGWVEFTFDAIHRIKVALGGTINDVVLSIVSGALGRYMRAHGDRTDGVELRAMCPMDVRPEAARGRMGNYVAYFITPLHVGITDPVKRLHAERAAMDSRKRQGQGVGIYDLLFELGNMIPFPLQELMGRTGTTSFLLMNPLNTVSTNVPGPQRPLYLAGYKLIAAYPLGPLFLRIGLFNAILSYDHKLAFGVTVDPNLVPDVWFYVQCLQESYAELHEAALLAAPAIASALAPAPATDGHGAAEPPAKEVATIA